MMTSTCCATQVVVVDDDRDVRESLDWTLRSVGYDVVSFGSAREALGTNWSEPPGCFIVDLLLPGMTGLTLCQQIALSNMASTFIMISGHADVVSAIDAMKAGATDFLLKPLAREKLLAAVDRAVSLSNQRQLKMSEELRIAELVDSLSARERDVFDCLARGLVTKQIASALNVSPKTIDVHRSNIARKLDMSTPSQLAYVLFIYQRYQSRSSRDDESDS